MRVGLTGGIGAGKSEVARTFAGLGAVIIEADDLAREAVAPESEGYREVVRHWPQVRNDDGSLDRAALSSIVFDDAAARRELGAIVHPFVRRRAAEIEAAAGPHAIVVHVVPLLFEGDYWKSCAATVLVYASRETRIERVVRRSGLSRDDVERRMALQIDPEQARALATYVIENDGDRTALEAAASRVYGRLRVAAS